MIDQNDSIVVHLKSLKNIIYRANEGNLGDCVIAYAQNYMMQTAKIDCCQLLSPYAVEIKDYDNNYIACDRRLLQPFDFVYGGGGLWTCHYNYSKILKMYMQRRNMRSCTILPSSFWRCDDAIKSFDERFTVFCREKQSYDYCKSLNSKARFLLHDDAAFWLDAQMLDANQLKHEDIALQQMKNAFQKIDIFLQNNANQAVGLFMRNDAEKTQCLSAKNSFDASSLCNVSGLRIDKHVQKQGALLLSKAVMPFKKIVTNRLHIAIVAALLGKEVAVYNNDYGKLNAIYRQSLHRFSNVQFKLV